jgi:hypothetical protein
MKKNVGVTDRIIRIILGLVVLSLIFIIQSDLRWLGLIGFIPLLTGVFGFCPLYALLHVSTHKKSETKS